MEKKFKGILRERKREDGGRALLTELEVEESEDKDNGMFVIVQSWDENKEHSEIRPFLDREITISIKI